MKTFPLQIVTPEGSFFDGEAQMIRLRTVDGDVAILADHMQYATAIGMGECRIVLPDDTERRAACCGGLLVAAGQVRVVAATFEWAEDIDIPRAEAAQQRAQAALDAGVTDPLEKAACKERLTRAGVRLRVAQER